VTVTDIDICTMCGLDPHTGRGAGGCPGDRATADEIASWLDRAEKPERQAYTLSDLEEMRWRDRGPRVRFWATDLAGNGLRMIEGTLDVGQVDVVHRGDVVEYTLTGHMWPPMFQYLIPDEIDHDLLPVAEVPDDAISTEVDMSDGFKYLGTIGPDDLKIETKADFDTLGGRTIQTRQETTVEFSTCVFDPDLMAELLRP
jgi:hypothetical protein